MDRIMRARPSPSMAVALMALFVALSGVAVAASALDKQEKKAVNKIAKKKAKAIFNKLAPGASVNTASTAANADRLDNLDSTDYLRSNAKAADAELLDSLDSSAFLRSDAKAADAERLDGVDSSGFLGASATAANAEQLDGVDSSDFVRGAGRLYRGQADLANGGSATLIDATGVGRVSASCTNLAGQIQLTYTNLSGANQIVVEDQAEEGTPPADTQLNANVRANTAENTYLLTDAGTGIGYIARIGSAPETGTGSGIAVFVTGMTKGGTSNDRCLVQAVGFLTG